MAGGSHNTAQRLVDTVGTLGEVLAEYAEPAKRAVKNMMTDQIRPDYWVADADIEVRFPPNFWLSWNVTGRAVL